MTKEVHNLSHHYVITMDYQSKNFKEDIQCHIRFHGSHCLSPIFPLHITSGNRIQMNFECEDVGELMALEVQLVADNDDGLFIKSIEICIPKKKILQKFEVQRWLHPNMGDGRTRLIVKPNESPGYEPKKMLKNIQQPRRDYVKYKFFIEVSKTKGDVEHSLLLIDLIGRYGRTSFHPLNKKSDQIAPLKVDSKPNIFNLTMLDVGELQACEVKLENPENNGAYLISKMYIYRDHHYEVDIHQWIETNQSVNANLRLLETPIVSNFFNKVQLKRSFVLWITGSDLLKKEKQVPIKFQFNCQESVTNPIEETINIQANYVSVLSIALGCEMPLNSVALGYNRKSIDYCLAKEIVVLDVLQGRYYYFQPNEEPPETSNDIDYYTFIPKSTDSPSATKHYIISILTSEKNTSDGHVLKVVLRGEQGFTTMLLLQNSTWNKIPFQAKHKDKFLFLASDIGKIQGITIFHTSEETKFCFNILEIFVPDTKTCIRFKGKYEISNEVIDFNCQEPQVVYIVQIKSGSSTLNDTSDIILTLTGEMNSIEWLLLTCESDTKPFGTGQLDTFYIPTKKLGKIRAVDVRCSNLEANCKWFCETIFVYDPMLNIKTNYPINRWCGGQQESDLTDTSSAIQTAKLTQPTSTKPLATFLLAIKNGIRSGTNPMVAPSIYIYFTGPHGSSPVIHLNELTNRSDVFQSFTTNEFTFTIPDTGMPNLLRVWNTEDAVVWTCEYIDIKNVANSKTVHFPMGIDLQKSDPSSPAYIDLEADTGRVELSIPEPRDQAAFPSYELTLRTKQKIHSKDNTLKIQMKGDQNRSKIISLAEHDRNDTSKAKKTLNYLLYDIDQLGKLEEVLLYFDKNQERTKNIYEYILIYDYLMDKYYGTKINSKELYHKYKLGVIESMDPNQLDHQLDQIESELNNTKPPVSASLYRILCKTQLNALTNLTPNAQILLRLIGDRSTLLFPLEHSRSLLPGSLHESYYHENEYIHGLNEISLQLTDDENTQWACESIDVQDLKTDNITTFPIHDIIEATTVENAKTITWKSGLKPGIIYSIQIRTGMEGASLNFRYGSAHLSLKLYGDAGVSPELPLRIPLEQTFYLNSNQTDIFEIGQIISPVGQISSIDMFHNGKKEDFWCIDWIRIRDVTTNKLFHFVVEDCLNKDTGANSKVLHIPTDVSTRKSAHEIDSRFNYTVRVKTGSQTPVHSEETTDTPIVSIVLIDTVNDSNRIPLEQANDSARPVFQPGQEDRFDIKITPLSELKVLQLYFSGPFSWFCERMIVTDQSTGLSYRFGVEQWFNEKNEDNPVTILGQREDDIGWTYSIAIKTQAVLPAQTSLRGKIILSIYGEKSSLNDAILGSGRSMHKLFHAGAESTIELKSTKQLGQIHSIELRLEVAEWQSWLCDLIEIVDSTANWDFSARTAIPKTYKFPINRWLGAHAMDKQTVLHAKVNEEPGYAKMPTYIVHILTGNKSSQTDLDVPIQIYLQLFCSISNHVYGPILLDKSSNNTQPFRKGQIDEFHIDDLALCGEMKKIRLFHDGAKTTSWHCEWIKITNVQQNEVYEFMVEKILDEDYEEGSSNLILYSEKKEEIPDGELPTPRMIN